MDEFDQRDGSTVDIGEIKEYSQRQGRDVVDVVSRLGAVCARDLTVRLFVKIIVEKVVFDVPGIYVPSCVGEH